jgi:hypothetical protein
LRGETWTFEEKAITFQNGKLMGGPEDFLRWAAENHNYEEYRPQPLLEILTEEQYKSCLNNKNVSTCFFFNVTLNYLNLMILKTFYEGLIHL